jgi:hypothetical protein
VCILLAFAATYPRCADETSEGWNQIMSDYEVAEPSCVHGPTFFDSDCGGAVYAHALFVSWNILSMYIFVSMVYIAFHPAVKRGYADNGVVHLPYFREFQLRVPEIRRLFAGLQGGGQEVQAGMGEVRSGWPRVYSDRQVSAVVGGKCFPVHLTYLG